VGGARVRSSIGDRGDCDIPSQGLSEAWFTTPARKSVWEPGCGLHQGQRS